MSLLIFFLQTINFKKSIDIKEKFGKIVNNYLLKRDDAMYKGKNYGYIVNYLKYIKIKNHL